MVWILVWVSARKISIQVREERHRQGRKYRITEQLPNYLAQLIIRKDVTEKNYRIIVPTRNLP